MNTALAFVAFGIFMMSTLTGGGCVPRCANPLGYSVDSESTWCILRLWNDLLALGLDQW